MTVDAIRVQPILNSGPHPDFAVRARNQRGDVVEFVATQYGHVRTRIQRPMLRGLMKSSWNYNEYLVRIEQLEGRVDGELVSEGRMGQGFGTLEYAWVLGLRARSTHDATSRWAEIAVADG